MGDRWVPSGQEFDEGYNPNIKRDQPGPFQRLRKALTRRRTARHNVVVKDGVGESRSVTAPDRATSVARHPTAPPPATAPPATPKPAAAIGHGSTPAPASPSRHTAARSPAPPEPRKRPRKPVHLSNEIVAPHFSPQTETDDDAPAGAWEPKLSDREMSHRIGPIMQYGDDT
jgi:hypothetical protein